MEQVEKKKKAKFIMVNPLNRDPGYGLHCVELIFLFCYYCKIEDTMNKNKLYVEACVNTVLKDISST